MKNELTNEPTKKVSIFKRKFHFTSKTMMFGYAIFVASFALNYFNIDIATIAGEIANIDWDNIKVGLTTFFFLILRTITSKPLEGNGWGELVKWIIDKLLGRTDTEE